MVANGGRDHSASPAEGGQQGARRPDRIPWSLHFILSRADGGEARRAAHGAGRGTEPERPARLGCPARAAAHRPSSLVGRRTCSTRASMAGLSGSPLYHVLPAGRQPCPLHYRHLFEAQPPIPAAAQRAAPPFVTSSTIACGPACKGGPPPSKGVPVKVGSCSTCWATFRSENHRPRCSSCTPEANSLPLREAMLGLRPSSAIASKAMQLKVTSPVPSSCVRRSATYSAWPKGLVRNSMKKILCG